MTKRLFENLLILVLATPLVVYAVLWLATERGVDMTVAAMGTVSAAGGVLAVCAGRLIFGRRPDKPRKNRSRA